MKLRKTKTKERNKYVYQPADGTKIEITTAEQGVTEILIKTLHSLDDSEVYSNIKNCKPKLNTKEKETKKQWELEHPNEKYPEKWNVSIDEAKEGQNLLIDKMMASATHLYDVPVTDEVQTLRMFIETLPLPQQKLYTMKYIHEYSQSEIALALGVSNPAITKQVKALEKVIKNKFEKFLEQG